MAEVVAGANRPLLMDLPGVVVQVVAGLAVKRLAVPPTVLREQQIRAVAVAAEGLAVQVARAL